MSPERGVPHADRDRKETAPALTLLPSVLVAAAADTDRAAARPSLPDRRHDRPTTDRAVVPVRQRAGETGRVQ